MGKRAKHRINYDNFGTGSPGVSCVTSLQSYHGTEAYMKSELFHRLKLKGVIAIPEFIDKRNRYDLLILDSSGRPALIVEIKSKRSAVDLEQIEEYERNTFKIPVLVLAHLEDFDYILNKIIKHLLEPKVA